MKQILLFIFFGVSVIVNAQNQERNQQLEKEYESQLAKIDSSLVSVFHAATLAMDENDLVRADSLYTIVYQKAQEFDVVNRRLGTVRLLRGKIFDAIRFCEIAESLNHSTYNLMSVAYCYMAKSEMKDLDKAYKLLDEAQSLPDGDNVEILTLIGQIALEKNSVVALKKITQKLYQKYPNVMVTHFYGAIVAAQEEDWEFAEKEIRLAEKLGLDAVNVKQFLDSGVQDELDKISIRNWFIVFFLSWIVGLLLLFGIGKILSITVLKIIEKQVVSKNFQAIPGAIRPIYNLLMNIAGVYYYISLPIILILIVVLVVGVMYLSTAAGFVPIKILLFLIIGAGISIYSLVRSLLIKIDNKEPGRLLKENEAPELYKLTKQVAQKIGTRPVDEIRITHYTDLAVYERGTWKEKMRDTSQRVLIIGAGVVDGFKQDELRAILAHEYGHFSHRDTAGGAVALRVINDMNKYAYALYSAGQNVWWNIAFQFLRLYSFIFRRISHGAIRLQEIMADRVAVQNYGARAFERGLSHVIKQNIKFEVLANKEVNDSMRDRRSMSNLYELENTENEKIEEMYHAVFSENTTEDNTHPSPKDRLRFIEGITANESFNDSSLVSDLFENWNSITIEMTELVSNKN